MQGFHAVWKSNRLTCQPEASTYPVWVVPIAVVLSVVGCMLLAAAGLLVWFRMAVQLRMRWHREQEIRVHKKLGMPSTGLATIVVTDIEQYSGEDPGCCSQQGIYSAGTQLCKCLRYCNRYVSIQVLEKQPLRVQSNAGPLMMNYLHVWAYQLWATEPASYHDA